MIKRDMEKVLRQRASEFPVITVTGPRQSGKTTLVRNCFPRHAYVNLEDPETRELAQNDYKRFFDLYKPPIIVDEIQRVPQLVSAIQTLVDEKRRKCGQFILTSSHQPKLKETVSQSLAGRSAFLKLLPLTFSEMAAAPRRLDRSADALILRGGMPELAITKTDPNVYYRNYLQSYVERDVRQIANIRNTSPFNRFLTLLAGRVGQLVNLNSLSGEVGVSHTALSGWLDILEASFVVFRLQPYFANIGKRLVKTPKIYFTETGLAACLLGLKTADQVARDPLRGNLFENLVVSDLLKRNLNRDDEGELFFLRTSDGIETDVLRKAGSGRLQPIEIKSAMTWTESLGNGLRRACKIIPDAQDPTLIYSGNSYPAQSGDIARINFLDAE